jgi:hypothetical protein
MVAGAPVMRLRRPRRFPRLRDLLVGRRRGLAAVLAHDVRVVLQRLRRRVAHLVGDVDYRRALLAHQQRHERVAQVVRPRRAEPDRARVLVEDPVAPVVPVVCLPRPSVRPPREEQLPPADPADGEPAREVFVQRVEQVDRAVHPAGLLDLQLAE